MKFKSIISKIVGGGYQTREGSNIGVDGIFGGFSTRGHLTGKPSAVEKLTPQLICRESLGLSISIKKFVIAPKLTAQWCSKVNFCSKNSDLGALYGHWCPLNVEKSEHNHI